MKDNISEYMDEYQAPGAFHYGSKKGMSDKWLLRGGEEDLSQFYCTEYRTEYTRPATHFYADKMPICPDAQPRRIGTGYGSNNHVSPLELAELKERELYKTTTTHATHSDDSSVNAMMKPKPLQRSIMERSGFWNEPQRNILYESPHERVNTIRTRSLRPEVPALTLKRLKVVDPVQYENNGKGPEWGSTTHNASYIKHTTPHERYWKMDRKLIGRPEGNAFTKNHLTVSMKPVDDMISTCHRDYTKKDLTRGINIPSRTILEASGFSRSEKPTHNKTVPLSDVTAADLPPQTVSKMKLNDTPQYQNLFNPDPWISTCHVSYKDPNIYYTQERSFENKEIQKTLSGYGHNETVKVGAPGDARGFKTGKTTYRVSYKDPELGFRGHVQKNANVVERSGYWNGF